MKKYMQFVVGALLIISFSFVLSGCGISAEGDDLQAAKETKTVNSQQAIYAKGQPIPLFNYSLPRDLWTQFYKASTADVVRTWSVEVSAYGTPISEIYESVGYPIPMDTQLTNSQMVVDDPFTYSSDGSGGQVVAQPEPNGLYTSPNTNATIIMVADENGNVAPIYSEHMVQAWPFKVEWDEARKIFVRASGAKSTIVLKTTGVKK